MARLAPTTQAVVFGGLHFALQIVLYALGFAVGPEAATREVLGVSLHGIAVVVTFPFVTLAERLQWSGVGIAAFLLNSVAWGAAFRFAAAGWAAVRKRRSPRA